MHGVTDVYIAKYNGHPCVLVICASKEVYLVKREQLRFACGDEGSSLVLPVVVHPPYDGQRHNNYRNTEAIPAVAVVDPVEWWNEVHALFSQHSRLLAVELMKYTASGELFVKFTVLAKGFVPYWEEPLPQEFFRMRTEVCSGWITSCVGHGLNSGSIRPSIAVCAGDKLTPFCTMVERTD